MVFSMWGLFGQPLVRGPRLVFKVPCTRAGCSPARGSLASPRPYYFCPAVFVFFCGRRKALDQDPTLSLLNSRACPWVVVRRDPVESTSLVSGSWLRLRLPPPALSMLPCMLGFCPPLNRFHRRPFSGNLAAQCVVTSVTYSYIFPARRATALSRNQGGSQPT